jgi:diacylglycerol kinase family enzyme
MATSDSETRRPVLFVNPRSGGGKAEQAGLAGRARELGIEAVVLRPGDDLGELVADAVARGADALGAAGGDGSLAVVAAAAIAHDLPFVCVPAGTRNHFARDVGVDRRDLVGSLDAFAHGVERRVDVGEVNGRLFLNNVSLGIYGDAVQQPEYRDAKARTLLQTAAQVLGPSAAPVGLELVDDEGRRHVDPAVVLVSNNPYSLAPPQPVGTRSTLESGRLGIIVLDRPGVPAPRRTWTAERFAASAPGPVRAGLDGEAAELSAPIEWLIRPGALRVLTAPSRVAGR